MSKKATVYPRRLRSRSALYTQAFHSLNVSAGKPDPGEILDELVKMIVAETGVPATEDTPGESLDELNVPLGTFVKAINNQWFPPPGEGGFTQGDITGGLHVGTLAYMIWKKL